MGEAKRTEAYMNFIRPNRCATCSHKHLDANKEMQCRLNPPTVMPVIAMGPKGPSMMGQVNVFPVVQPDWWCSKFSGVISLARDEQAPGVEIEGKLAS